MNTVPTATKVADTDRSEFLFKHFGVSMVRVEMMVYAEMDRLCEAYNGGYWEFYELSNGGFYMAIDSDEPIRVVNGMNYSDEEMSLHSACLTACLFIWNKLCWAFPNNEAYTKSYYALHEYACLARPDASKILKVIN